VQLVKTPASLLLRNNFVWEKSAGKVLKKEMILGTPVKIPNLQLLQIENLLPSGSNQTPRGIVRACCCKK
jgi:hypothetical protein